VTRKKIITSLLFASLSFTSLGCLSFPAAAAPPVEYVILISVDGLSGAYLNGLLDGTTKTETGQAYALPNFHRLVAEGASTMYAHIDMATYETLPNHVGMLTGRPRDGQAGHGWRGNGDPDQGQTLHNNKYPDGDPGDPKTRVSSAFDVARGGGLPTGLYANKSKIRRLFEASCDIDHVAHLSDDKDKYTGTDVVNQFIAQQKTLQKNGDKLMRFVFLHVNNLDNCGHNYQWGSTAWNEQVVAVDAMVGALLAMIEDKNSPMYGKTALVLTADHGEQNKYEGVLSFAVPLMVWGPSVEAGADLYKLNAGTRKIPDWKFPVSSGGQRYLDSPTNDSYVYDFDAIRNGGAPIYNLEAGNLALSLLGLKAIPGSIFGALNGNLLYTPKAATR